MPNQTAAATLVLNLHHRLPVVARSVGEPTIPYFFSGCCLIGTTMTLTVVSMS